MLGAKQGKTERYRTLFRHLQHSSDLFTHAEGERGMVMIVFTLDSLDIVFKVIRDRFAYPKTTTREEVMEKYRFVFQHDRVGRLVDAQEFRRLRFPKGAVLAPSCSTSCWPRRPLHLPPGWRRPYRRVIATGAAHEAARCVPSASRTNWRVARFATTGGPP